MRCCSCGRVAGTGRAQNWRPEEGAGLEVCVPSQDGGARAGRGLHAVWGLCLVLQTVGAVKGMEGSDSDGGCSSELGAVHEGDVSVSSGALCACSLAEKTQAQSVCLPVYLTEWNPWTLTSRPPQGEG